MLQKYNFHTIATVVFSILLVGTAGQGVLLPAPFIVASGVLFTQWGWAKAKGFLPDNLATLAETYKRWLFAGCLLLCFAAINISPTQKRIAAEQKETARIAAALRDSLAEVDRKNKRTDRELAEAKDPFKQYFSEWDGSCKPLVKAVKEQMNDPKSFEHIETRYLQSEGTATVKMKFRGKNSFGANVVSLATAKLSRDGGIGSLEITR